MARNKTYNLIAPAMNRGPRPTLPNIMAHATAMLSYLCDFNPEYCDKIKTQDNIAFIHLADRNFTITDVQVMKIAFNTLLESTHHVKLPPQSHAILLDILECAQKTFAIDAEDWKDKEIGDIYNLVCLQADMLDVYTVEQWDKICAKCLNQQTNGRKVAESASVEVLRVHNADADVAKVKKMVKRPYNPFTKSPLTKEKRRNRHDPAQS